MKYWSKHAFFIAVVTLFSGTAATSSLPEKEKCITCHNTIYDNSLHNSYIHRPFLNKECAFCHLEESSSSLSNESQSSQDKKPKINWLQKHYGPAQTHFFLIPSAKVDDTLFIQTTGYNGRPQTTSLPLPPLQQLPQMENDNQQPEIDNIQFHGVTRGILYSATISWHTNEPADSQIHYGKGSFKHKTRLASQLKRDHMVTISPVTPDTTYNYTAVSKDMYGNRSISQPLSFSTKKIPYSNAVSDAPQNKVSSSQIKLTHKLSASGDNYFLAITADKPIPINIGGHQNLSKIINIPGNNGDPASPLKHAAIKNSYETNIAVCLNCHKDYQSESSHPINVGPKRGMTFPKDYAVLEDGRMHCMTCHDAHASDNEARIRRSPKKELCIGCHKNYG